jgi:hypothetical protein
MAATRLIALHQHKKAVPVAQSLGERTDYAKKSEKTEKGANSHILWLRSLYGSMKNLCCRNSAQYYQTTGKKQHSDVIALPDSGNLSSPVRFTAEEANRGGV